MVASRIEGKKMCGKKIWTLNLLTNHLLTSAFAGTFAMPFFRENSLAFILLRLVRALDNSEETLFCFSSRLRVFA